MNFYRGKSTDISNSEESIIHTHTALILTQYANRTTITYNHSPYANTRIPTPPPFPSDPSEKDYGTRIAKEMHLLRKEKPFC